jgi:tetratricopeptide (TPR) repeat protein
MARRSQSQIAKLDPRADRPSPPLLAGAALIAAAVFLIYSPSLRGDFVLDDELLVSRTALIRAPDALYRYWFTTQATDYWPVTNSSFWLEFRLWETNPTGYRVTNLILHVLDCVLIWLILRRLAIPGAFVAALLFAVHPVNVESVAWIAQRKNVLSLLFFLLAVWFYIKSQQLPLQRTDHGPSADRGMLERASGDWRWYWLSVVMFVLAGLSKGSVVILPLVLLLIAWWQRGRVTKLDLVHTVPFFVVALAITLIDIWFQTHGSAESIRQATPLERLLGAGAVVWFYLWKALVPLWLVFIYPQWHIDAGAIGSWLPLIAAVSVTVILIWQRNTFWGRPLLFAWAFFCVALLPVMGFTDVGFMKHSLVADHYQHIALIGVVAVVAAAITYFSGRSYSAAFATIAIVLVILGFLSFRQAELYGQPIRLYETTLAVNPDSWLAEVNMANILADAGQTQDAAEHYRRSLALNERNPAGHVNLGLALEALGQAGAAMGEYRRAIEIQNDYLPAINDLGNALAAAGKTEDAIAKYQDALRIKPDYPAAHFGLGTALRKLGRTNDAIEHFQQAVATDPYYFDAYLTLANTLADAQRLTEAIECYQKALPLNPNDPEAHYNFAATLTDAHRLPEAIGQYQEVLRLAPNHFEAESSLGAALAMSGRLPESLAHFQRALKLKPDYGDAYFNLAMAQAAMRQAAEARGNAKKALELARSQGQTDLASRIESWLAAQDSGSR